MRIFQINVVISFLKSGGLCVSRLAEYCSTKSEDFGLAGDPK